MSSGVSLDRYLDALQASHVDFGHLVLHALTQPDRHAFGQLQSALDSILSLMQMIPILEETLLKWAYGFVKIRGAQSIRRLASKDNPWHFGAIHTTPQKLRTFKIEEMASKIEETAPEIWELVGSMLGHEGNEGYSVNDTEDDLDEEEKQYWAALDGVEHISKEEKKRERRVIWRHRLIRIKQVVIVSIMMQSTNQQCNSFQSIMTMFLHAKGAADTIVKTFAHMGVCLSVQSKNNGVRALSLANVTEVRLRARTLLAGYAYDNYDVLLPTSTPTVEQGSSDALTHLTSGCLLNLAPGVVLEDLKCSKFLWESSPFNPRPTRNPYPPHISLHSITHLVNLHPENPHPSGLTRRECFNARIFLHDLCTYYGDDFDCYYKNMLARIPNPEAIDQIPLTKLDYMPFRSMDINQSTNSGNIEAMDHMTRIQGGVGDPNDPDELKRMGEWESDLVDLSEYVLLVHGDLSTYKRLLTDMERRGEEDTPCSRLQYVVFVMGLFHLKMACADALWRIFIEPKSTWTENNSIMSFVKVLRPRETGKIGSKPKFRQIHEVILHSGTVLRLDAWRVKARKLDPEWQSLDVMMASKPSMEKLQRWAEELACERVANPGLYEARWEATSKRDRQHENIQMVHQYFLLYEEMSYAMNAGDIGRVETLFPEWIALFRGCGKHQYATAMIQFMTDVHYRYPPGLKKAVRYNMLVNPTGALHKFRGVDWVVELLNLFTKFTYGGEGSNFTKARIILESINVLEYRGCISNIERNFLLSGLSFTHGSTDMRKTFTELLSKMADKDWSPNEFIAGRSSTYVIPDIISKGMEKDEGDAMDVDGMGEQDSSHPDAEDLGAEGDI